jgi:hypothetical protein
MALTSRRLTAFAAVLTLAACGGSSGSTTPDPQCTTAAECPGTDTECRTRTCTGGTCGFSFAADTVVVASQTAGDCQVNRCDGAGGVHAVADDADVPADDDNACTSEACAGGAPVHPPLAANAPCAQGGAYCDGAGSCVECTAAAQCGTDTECRAFTCLAGACGVEDQVLGTAVSAQTPGDCRSNVCDGSGGVISGPLGTDVPFDDGNPCTAEVCDAGAPAHPPVAAGTACSQGGGAVCDGAAHCVACNVAADCGASTACKTFTCLDHACGVTKAPAGTVAANPTPGDCRSDQCDGNGEVLANQVDAADVPADDGNACTADVCAAGAPAHPARDAGTACSQGGGKLCSGAGACVQCLSAADCGTSTACQTFTCTAGVCGSTKTAAGTMVADPTPGDCHTDRCDGAGNVVDTIDDTDLPGDDGNQCTGESCTAGHPARPAAASGTACNQGGGTKCDGAGHCVQCLSSRDCGGDLACDGENTCRTQPTVVATNPADGGKAATSTAISITFSEAMAPSSLTASTSGTACTGTIQLSADGFATCAPFSPPGSPTMSGGNRTATLVPAAALLPRTYKLRVTVGALSAFWIPLPAAYTSPSGFTTATARPVEYCALVWPIDGLQAEPGAETGIVYGQIYEAGVTEAAGASSLVTAQVGYGPQDADPRTDPGWTWSAAVYGSQAGNNDEYVGRILAPAAGMYRYTYRFSVDDGTSWTYCDTDGAGSNAGFSFDLARVPFLTVGVP